MDWSRSEEDIDLDGTDSTSMDDTESDGSLQIADLIFQVHRRAKQRPDSLRRRVENQHLSRFPATDRVTCPGPACNDAGVAPFLEREG